MALTPWRKILYEKQDFPDNYVDKTQFLNGLKKNCKRCTGYCLHGAQCAMKIALFCSTHTDLRTAGSDPSIGGGHTRTE